MTPGVQQVFAGYLEEMLGSDWRVDVWDKGALTGVGVSCFIDRRRIEAARHRPGGFLDSLTPDVNALRQALTNRRAYRPSGPYASRAILRRKAGL